VAQQEERPLAGESSIELVQRARRGDNAALERLFARYVAPLRRWATGRLPRWARGALDTDDLVQEALIATFRNLESFEPQGDGALHAYLRQALRRRVVDELRRARRRPASAELSADPADPAASPLEEAIGAEALEQYERALEQVGAPDREIIVSRVELGLSYEEIARACGKPSAEAARMAVSRALVRLAKEMGREA